MFTGIIREIGILNKKIVHKRSGVQEFLITCKKLKLHDGDSVAVNGACLTVKKVMRDGFVADVVEETLARTNLNNLKPGSKLNLEQPIRAGEGFDGHFVSGHIDAVAKIIKSGPTKNGIELKMELPKGLARYIAEKGSVTINGVALTITDISTKSFSVVLIPYTLKNTNLGAAKVDEAMNIEVDLIARYLYNFYQHA